MGKWVGGRVQGRMGTQDPQKQKSRRVIRVSASRQRKGKALPSRDQSNARDTGQARRREHLCGALSWCRG